MKSILHEMSKTLIAKFILMEAHIAHRHFKTMNRP
jgi:hypothetical protein